MSYQYVMRWMWYGFLALFSLGMIGLVGVIGGAVWAVSYYGRDLPDYSALKDYQPPVVTRVYTDDGRLMAEFATEKRIFVPIDTIPPLVRDAFIAAEDQNFYSHQGVDYTAIARAILINIKNLGHGRRPVGASTITQQVAKNFLLTNEVSIKRKIREAILAYRMENAMSKDRLLELYLNQIYLGRGAYGVAAAAQTYFGKALPELRIEEVGYLAALPKAPSNYNPATHYDAALARRDWVIGRMAEDGYITDAQRDIARATPLTTVSGDNIDAVRAPYFAEEVRRELIDRYGENGLYRGGLVVRTSLDPRLQEIAARALRNGLVAYDKRHGYRGPLTHFATTEDWREKLADVTPPAGKPDTWRVAVVLKAGAQEAEIGFSDGNKGKFLLPYLGWARRDGKEVTAASDVVKAGDVVMAEQVEEDGKKVWGLRQIPKVNGALVAMDPHTGRVLAMQGGWSYDESEFNRATQAKRQPGSSFKPFIYLSALDKGLTPATLVLDAPLVIDQGPGLPKWRPVNYSGDFSGPTPLRIGIEHSKNLMTVRIADYVGMNTVAAYAKKFGVVENLEPYISNSLGSGETTLLNMTTGYAQLVNGGRKIIPTVIDRIQDRDGKTVFSHDTRPCEGCGPMLEWTAGMAVPSVPDTREQIADPRTAYQMVSILEGVVQRGTAVRAKSLGVPLAGKTGTTNDSKDTWFVGFTPDLVTGVFIGFDEPKTMGRKETGSSVSLPVFIEFMKDALKETSPVPFRVPPGIRHVQINQDTGARAKPGDERVIWESFIAGTEPGAEPVSMPYAPDTLIEDENGNSLMPAAGGGESGSSSWGRPGGLPDPTTLSTGTGGIY